MQLLRPNEKVNAILMAEGIEEVHAMTLFGQKPACGILRVSEEKHTPLRRAALMMLQEFKKP
jgi:hypothetical protein